MKYLIAGDVHGDIWNIKDLFQIAKETNCNKIIVVGDFGWFPNLNQCKEFLSTANFLISDSGIELAFVDGNHENHEFLNQFSGDCRKVFGEIEWLYRGKMFDSICSMGGAYSIDKAYRTVGVDYFPEETLNLNNYYSILGKECDILLSHDCPLGIDFGFKDDFHTKVNRNLLREIVLELKPKTIIHGHYHKFYFMNKDFGYGNVKVIGLNRNGSKMSEQCVILENGEVEIFPKFSLD